MAFQHRVKNFSKYAIENDRIYLKDICRYPYKELKVGGVIKAKLIDKIIDFQKSLYTDCNILSRSAELPVNYVEYMYGDPDDTFRVFIAPAVLTTSIYFLASANAATVMLTDRLEGIWDRSVVAGVSTLEIVLVHFVSQFLIIFIQNTIDLVAAFPIYGTENAGSFVTVTIITLLAGVCGACFGFLVSIVSNNHSMANNLSTGTLFPMMLLSGLLWPIEGLPIVLKWISYCLPVTLPTASLRNVMSKGWSIFHIEVINGIAIEMLWIIFFLALTAIAVKRKR